MTFRPQHPVRFSDHNVLSPWVTEPISHVLDDGPSSSTSRILQVDETIRDRCSPPLRPRQIAQRARRRREKIQRRVMTSSDVLLIIFRHYLDASPRFWFKLAHVCRSWRRIIFTSPLGLHLRLYCTYGTPVMKNLNCWPPLPLVVNYGGFHVYPPPGSEDEDNIMAALEKSDRVCSISLTVSSSLLKKLSTVSEPFSDLEELVLLSQDNDQLTLPSTFFGHRLHTLHSTRISISSLPQLLLPSQGLVDLRLNEIPGVGYFSPEAFANALRGMTQLQTLSLHFLSFPPRRNYLSLPPPPGDRVDLPALTRFTYRGISKYLDSLVARIDAPRLEDINITFFSQPTLSASQLGLFISRIEVQRSPLRAEILSSGDSISITFTRPGALSTRLGLQVSCRQLDWQLSSISQICDQFSSLLFSVEDLRVKTIGPSNGSDGTDDEHWLQLIRTFEGTKDFRVVGKHATDILHALHPADEGQKIVLPSLRNLHLQEPVSVQGPLRDSVESIVTQRQLSGCPVEIYYAGQPPLQRTIQFSKLPPLPLDRFEVLFTQFANTTGLRLNDRDFVIDGRPISPWALHRAVFARKGFESVTANDEWPAVGAALGFPPFPAIAHRLQQLHNDSLRHFEKAYINNVVARLPVRGSQALVSAQASQQQAQPHQPTDADYQALLANIPSNSSAMIAEVMSILPRVSNTSGAELEGHRVPPHIGQHRDNLQRAAQDQNGFRAGLTSTKNLPLDNRTQINPASAFQGMARPPIPNHHMQLLMSRQPPAQPQWNTLQPTQLTNNGGLLARPSTAQSMGASSMSSMGTQITGAGSNSGAQGQSGSMSAPLTQGMNNVASSSVLTQSAGTMPIRRLTTEEVTSAKRSVEKQRRIAFNRSFDGVAGSPVPDSEISEYTRNLERLDMVLGNIEKYIHIAFASLRKEGIVRRMFNMMASSKFQLEESKKLNPRYVLELHTIRGMIQEADSMDKGLRTVIGLKLARQGNAPVPQQPQPHSMDPTSPSFVAPPARRKVSNKANSLEAASTALAVTSTPTASTRTKGGVKRIREDVADDATLGVASAPSPKRVKTDLEGPLNEEAQNHGEASRECQDRGS